MAAALQRAARRPRLLTVPVDAASYVRQNGMSCYTVGGGRLVAPDLKDVTARRDRVWLRKFVARGRDTEVC